MRTLLAAYIAAAIVAGAIAPVHASTIYVDAFSGGTSFDCCGGQQPQIEGYLSPLYTFSGGTVDFGSILLSPFVESVGPSIFQVFMGSVTSADGPIQSVMPTVIYGDSCVSGYGLSCGNLYFPNSISESLVFDLPDNEATELQLAFLGSFQYTPPTETPLPATWPLMLGGLIALGFFSRRSLMRRTSHTLSL